VTVQFVARTREFLQLGQVQAQGANLFHIRGGKVTRLVHYWGR
jgi:hypothetical protein